MIGVIVNPRSGFVATHGLTSMLAMIEQELPEAAVTVMQPHDDVKALCRDLVAAGATCVAAAGGDGTVSSVAAHLVGTETALGVIPAGTLNHFARDVGVGHDIPTALRVLTAGHLTRVDVGQVNGRVFVNNSSIGVYARMVEIRRRYERRLGKWRALVVAVWLAARYASPTVVKLDSAAEPIRTYLLFVGNNDYEVNLLHLGRRASLDAGRLCCFVLESSGRIGLFPHFFRYLRDHRGANGLLRSIHAAELMVFPAGRRVRASCDGEVVMMSSPLAYKVLPRALSVVVPGPAQPGVAAMHEPGTTS